jgi:4-amino-4-deoxy-L-arabinose transferase-like glycosyltransferase
LSDPSPGPAAVGRAPRRGKPLDPPPGSGPGGGAPRRASSAFDAAPSLTRRLGPWLGLIALCLALYLPGLAGLPPVDRDEARFAQATKQMIETGDYVRIRYQDEARNKKPVGIYWAQAASARLFGGAAAPIWAYRLPSVAALTAAVLLLYALGRRLFEPRTAFLAASLLAACLLAVVEAHLAKTDAGLLAATVAAQGALGLIYLRARADLPAGWLLPLGFWIALALGILIKGPVLPLVSALAIAALAIADRSIAWVKATRPLPGALLAAAIVAPWAIAITRATDGAFLADAVGNDLIPKLIGGQESHGAPPGYHLLLLMLGFFPASLMVAPALREAWRQRRLPAERFCLAWLVPAWLVFELVPTKLPHYVLPLYPALALITARCVIGGAAAARATPAPWVRALMVLWFVVALALVGTAVALPVVVDRRIDWVALAPVLAGGIAAGAALVYGWRGHAVRASVIAVAGAGVLLASVFGTVLPRVDGLWLSRAAAEMVLAHRPSGHAPVIAAGYAEPSLVFLVGTATTLTGGGGAAIALAAHADALALVASDQEAAFHTQAAALGLRVEELARRSGYNYSRGRWTALTLYRRTR